MEPVLNAVDAEAVGLVVHLAVDELRTVPMVALERLVELPVVDVNLEVLLERVLSLERLE